MNNCKEFVLDDLMAITAIPVSSIPAGDRLSPANALTPVIAESDFSTYTLADAITIGLQPLTTGGALVPIIKHTGKVKDDESDSVAGRMHTVTVTCEIDDRDADADAVGKRVWDYLLALERTACHLLLSFRNKKWEPGKMDAADYSQQAFVSATEDTYLCNAERDGKKVTVTLRIQNLMGMQLII